MNHVKQTMINLKYNQFLFQEKIKKIILKVITLGQPLKDQKLSQKFKTLLNSTDQVQVIFLFYTEISGSGSGTKLPTVELLKNPGVFYEGEWKNGQ